MKNICDECNKESALPLYLFGYWFYDNNGNTSDFGKQNEICYNCLELKEKDLKRIKE